MVCCSGFSCFGTHRADTFQNLRWLRTILCTESREIPVCRTMSEIYTRRSDCKKASTAAIMASVVATTCRPGRSLSTMHSLPPANFVHQTCIAGLVKQLLPSTGRISEWISFAISPFAHKKRITARCSLWDNFNGNVTMFINDVTVRNKTHSWYTELNSLQNVYFGFFIFGKLTEWRCFVTYSSNDPCLNPFCTFTNECRISCIRIWIWIIKTKFALRLTSLMPMSTQLTIHMKIWTVS